MKWLRNIQAIRFYILRIDMSDPGLMLTAGMVFRKLIDRVDLDQKMTELPL